MQTNDGLVFAADTRTSGACPSGWINSSNVDVR
jgi:hypothetical protein